MTAKKVTKRQTPALTPDAPARGFVSWCLLSALIVLNRHDRWLSGTVSIVNPPELGVLAPEWAWSVPLGRLTEFGVPTDLPVWAYATLCGAVIGVLGRGIAMCHGVPCGMLALVAWSVAVEPDDVVTGLLILAASMVANSGGRTSLGCTAILGSIGLSLISTVEFGTVWLHAGLVLTPRLVRDAAGRRHWSIAISVVATAVALLAAAAAYRSGCGAALLRPVNWIWLQPEQTFMPSLGAALTNPKTRLGHALLCCGMVWFWWQLMRTFAGRPSVPWRLLVFPVLGLACGRYLWLMTVSLASIPLELPPVTRSARRERMWLMIGCCLAAAFPLVSAADLSRELFGEGASAGQLDPTAWPVQSSVMLTNLDDSRDWQSKRLRSQYQLVVSDRWDVYGPDYPQYAAVCRDIVEVRNDSYLRTDGRWGGYTRPLKQWSPALFVVDSGNWDDLRGLALSPHWKTLGIDGARTVFGNAEHPQLRSSLRQSASTLNRLELPGMSGRPLEPNVVVVERPEDYRRAALALTALRLPYAGLRVLRADSRAPNTDVEAVCYLELAHRTRRYAGVPSLLDQPRGVDRARQLAQRSQLDPKLGLILARSLASLGLFEDARLQEQSALNRRYPAWCAPPQESQRTLASLLNSADASVHSMEPDGKSELELRLREALARGEHDAANSMLPQLDPSVRDYYAILAGVHKAPASQIADQISRLSAAAELPRHLVGEAEFYRGCLAVELGDPPTAVLAFAKSAELEPRSPFTPLRTLYWNQVDRQ